MQALNHALYVIANALLGPVVVALLALLGWTLCLLGGFLKEIIERRGVRRTLRACVELARTGAERSDIWDLLARSPSGLPRRFVEFVREDYSDNRIVAQAITEVENGVVSSVAHHSFITRISPMLGLLGTLIPLGPALSALANGDIGALAGNLVVAFTATVVGLLISGMAYGMGLARRTWYARDVSDLEFIVSQANSTEEQIDETEKAVMGRSH